MDRSFHFNNTSADQSIIPDFILATVSAQERWIFTWCTAVIFFISIIGNTATIIVNSKRKMRPFFRLLLISLACSDIITTTFSSMGYISQLSDKYMQIWHLGNIMCACIPFMSTSAILINSMTLVGIAFDRYMAVMKVVSGVNWEPGLVSCFSFFILSWGLSAGLASPMIMSYHTKDVMIVITNPNNRSECIDTRHVQLCLADTALSTFYFSIIFSVVFIPLVLTFIWLNSIIAIEIWNRRKFNKNLQHNITSGIKTETMPSHPVTVRSLRAISLLENIFDNSNSCKSQNDSEKSTNTNSIPNRVETPSTLKTPLDNEDVLEIRKQLPNLNIPINFFNMQLPSTSASITLPPTQSDIVSRIDLKTKLSSENQQQQQQQCRRGAPPPPPPSTLLSNNQQNHNCSRNKRNYPNQRRREARQLRLFIVIILLMSVFLICRLPSWIFLLLTNYGKYNCSVHWLLRLSFGILIMFNCLLNPFCYTFMTETTRLTLNVTSLFKRSFVFLFKMVTKPFTYLCNLITVKCCESEYQKNSAKFSTQNKNNNNNIKNTKNPIQILAGDNCTTKTKNKSVDCDKMNSSYDISDAFCRNAVNVNSNNCEEEDSSDRNPSCDSKEIYTIFQEK